MTLHILTRTHRCQTCRLEWLASTHGPTCPRCQPASPVRPVPAAEPASAPAPAPKKSRSRKQTPEPEPTQLEEIVTASTPSERKPLPNWATIGPPVYLTAIERQAEIIQMLCERPDEWTSTKEVAEHLEKDSYVAKYHLRALLDQDLVECMRDPRSARYWVWRAVPSACEQRDREKKA